MIKMREVNVFTFVILCLSNVTFGVELAAIFGDHMVFQADKPVKVWGTGSPGPDLAVSFNNQTVR